MEQGGGDANVVVIAVSSLRHGHHVGANQEKATMEFVLAYIDPGSGSLIIQGLIAGMVALPIFFRHQIARFVRTVRGTPEPTDEAMTDQDDAANSI
jgi:hypothetical protein